MYTLITGASSGIGRQIAICLSKSHRLILQGRDKLRLEETKRSCRDSDLHKIWALDFKEVEKINDSLQVLLKEIQAEIDCFVHCAGTLKILPVRSMEPCVVEEIMNVNYAAAVEITRLLTLKKVNKKSLRNIVFISSTASRYGARGFSAYCASKGALDAFMRAIAVELAPGVRANSVLPGAIPSAMTETMMSDPNLLSRMEAAYPLGIGKTTDVADTVEFLLSEKARWITGQQIIVDGGRTVDITSY